MTKLPDTVQRRLAAGFELRARKPRALEPDVPSGGA
jgi:hypothetical protein